jgi:hypothetical protein
MGQKNHYVQPALRRMFFMRCFSVARFSLVTCQLNLVLLSFESWDSLKHAIPRRSIKRKIISPS